MSEAPPPGKRIREFTDPQHSNEKGLLGVFEGVLRRSKTLMMVIILGLVYIVVATLMGVSLVPSLLLFRYLTELSSEFSLFLQLFVKGTSIALGFLIYGFTAIVVFPIVNFPVRAMLRPFRGPAYSIGVLGWYLHNTLTYALRYSFLDWITPTPFNIFFYRQMGMKIGRGTEVNSSNISDAGLITLEDQVTVGGSVTIICHYATGGFLIIKPVVVRKGATLGIRSIIMAGADIGEGAKVLPNSVVLPNTVIPAGETWAGIPARKLER